jgi:dTDP-4-dehydrorhamnose reductase
MTGGILILGSEGQVGAELVQGAGRDGIACEGLTHTSCDLADAETVKGRIAATSASMVVNAAAYTAVDRAEAEAEQAFAVNAQGVAALAASCARRGLPLIHISTDYVFDGNGRTPWREEDPVRPLSVYGASKAAGELAVRTIQPRHIILRTCGVFSPRGTNFPRTIVERALGGRKLRVVNDQIVCPTWAADLADAILTIARRILAGMDLAWGTYHYCGRGETNWYDFACDLMQGLRQRGFQVADPEPTDTASFGAPARRPAYSVLDCSRIEQRFGLAPRPWRDRLPGLVDGLAQQRAAAQPA